MTVRAVVIGDLMIDNISSILDVGLDQAISNKLYRASIKTRCGGTVLSFVKAACSLKFSRVSAIGKIGASHENEKLPDMAGDRIIKQLKNYQAKTHLALDPKQPTGQTIIIYLQEDQRLLLAESGANATFSLSDITTSMEEEVRNADLLLLSAVCFLYPKRAEAATHLMKLGKKHGSLVVVDVVPHSIYKYLDLETFKKYTAHAHGLIIENNTANRIFIEGSNNSASFDSNQSLAERLLLHYEFIVLQPSNELHILFDRSGHKLESFTGYEDLKSDEQKIGYSEFSSISLLYKYVQSF